MRIATPGLVSLLFLLAAYLSFNAPFSLAQDALDESQLKQLESLERAILYHPRKYRPGDIELFEKQAGKRLKYKTSQGEQSAWLISQTKGDKPEKLWAICGGNATVALEMAAFARSLAFETDAFVLIDYPGYGECSGQPSPQGIRNNVKQSIVAAAEQAGIDAEAIPDHVCAFGHSLGAAAALLGVEELKLRSAVLCAPFTSTREMAQARFAIPKTIPLQHPFDNRIGLKELTTNKGQCWIFHGDQDNVIPVTMSRKLGEEFKDTVQLSIIAGGRHNDILRVSKTDLRKAMLAARTK